jgi:adenosylhomocysteine nucleosidase
VDDLSFTDPCVVFALRREAAGFLREFRPQQHFPGAPCRARFCGPEWLTVLVLETGVGHQATESAAAWLLSQPKLDNLPYRPKVVLSAGYAGSLDDHLAVGDLILATEVVDQLGNVLPTTWPGTLPPGEWRPPLHRGRILTLPTLVNDPLEKKRLGSQHHALAVDMESAALARFCVLHHVPFGCLRAISDSVSMPLSPKLTHLLAGARASLTRCLTACLVSPSLIAELWRLAQRTRQASRQLALALGELLTLTLDWMPAD